MYLIIQWICDTEIMNAKATDSDGERNGLSAIKVVMKMVASRRFELRSQDPESRMIDHYTTRLSKSLISFLLIKLS